MPHHPTSLPHSVTTPDEDPRPAWGWPRTWLVRTMLGYAVATGLAAGLAGVMKGVHWTNGLTVPFWYQHDGIYCLALTKTIDETGWYYFNERIGQLGGLDYREVPTADGWFHYGVLWVLLRLGFDPFVTLNLFFLLTFPLTALTALFVCRRLGLSYPVGLMVSLLFTFQPFHAGRMGHPFLAACYFVPLGVLLAVRHYQGRLPFRRAGADGETRWTLHSPAALGALATAVLLGVGGVYFAYFACFFVMVAGMARAYAERRWAPAASAGILSVVTFAALLVSMLPAVHYRMTHPNNPDSPIRYPAESELYGLKVVQMLMPVTEHRWEPLRTFKARYSKSGTPLVNENDSAALGAVGAAGLLVLMTRLLLRRNGASDEILDGLAVLAAAGILLATVGGLGAAISWYVSPWIRAYNRVSIFISFFTLLAVGVLVHRLGQRLAGRPWRRGGLVAGVAALTAAGLWDETPLEDHAPFYRDLGAQLDSDRRFVERVEADAPHGGLVFQLPHGGYPERQFPNGMSCYELFRPYLHSKHLRWTYGSVSGHFGDEWWKRLTRRPNAALVTELAHAEAAGIFIDRLAYTDQGGKVEAELKALLGADPLVSDNGRHAYYDLRPYTDRLRAAVPPAVWAARHEQALHPIVPLYRNGFFQDESVATVGSSRWCAKSGEIHLRNNLDRPRAVRLRMAVHLPERPPGMMARLAFQTPGWQEEVEISPAPPRDIDQRLNLPPGTTVVRLQCDAPPLVLPADPRRGLVFATINIECVEE